MNSLLPTSATFFAFGAMSAHAFAAPVAAPLAVSANPRQVTVQVSYVVVSQADFDRSSNALTNTNGDFAPLLAELKKNGGRVVEEPIITTVDGISARIVQSAKVPVAPKAKNHKRTFVQLSAVTQVVPTINTDGSIKLDLKLRRTELTNGTHSNDTQTTKWDTVRTVKDGSTTILGGMELRTSNKPQMEKLVFVRASTVSAPIHP